MAEFLPKTLPCSRCGGVIEITEQRGTLMPGEVIIDVKARHTCDEEEGSDDA